MFAWCLDEERDAAGNAIAYRYRRNGDRLLLAEVACSIFSLAIAYEPRPTSCATAGPASCAPSCSGRAPSHCTVPARPRRCCARTPSPTPVAPMACRCSSGCAWRPRATATSSPCRSCAFTYSPADFVDWDVTEPTAVVAPPDLFDPSAQLVDLTGDGLPDLLQSAGSRMYLWRNGGDGRLDGPTAIEGVPSTVQLSQNNVAFADLDGNGRVDLFAVDQPLQLAFSSDGRGGFRLPAGRFPQPTEPRPRRRQHPAVRHRR